METKDCASTINVPAAHFHLLAGDAEIALPPFNEGASVTLAYHYTYPLICDDFGAIQVISRILNKQRVEVSLAAQLLYTIKPRTIEPFARLVKFSSGDISLSVNLLHAELIPATETKPTSHSDSAPTS